MFPVHQLPSDQRLLEFIDSVSATIKARSKEGVDAGVVPRSRGIDISGTWLHEDLVLKQQAVQSSIFAQSMLPEHCFRSRAAFRKREARDHCLQYQVNQLA